MSYLALVVLVWSSTDVDLHIKAEREPSDIQTASESGWQGFQRRRHNLALGVELNRISDWIVGFCKKTS